MKKLINSAETVVTDALAGVAAAHPSLAVDIENKVITRSAGPTAGKVGLVSGGGSGHEPLHGGFVGYGMLDAACPGEVFTSPVPDQMLAATKAVNGDAGVLHIVKNYTGDVLNFQMAAELAEDEVMATVVLRDGMTFDPDSLIVHCLSRLPRHAVPRYIALADRLPLTDNGKVRKRELRALGITELTWDGEAGLRRR